jgi:hypothetical protein
MLTTWHPLLQKLVLTSPTSGGHSWTQARDFFRIQNNKLWCDRSIISIKVHKIGKAKDLSAPLTYSYKYQWHMAILHTDSDNGYQRHLWNVLLSSTPEIILANLFTMKHSILHYLTFSVDSCDTEWLHLKFYPAICWEGQQKHKILLSGKSASRQITELETSWIQTRSFTTGIHLLSIKAMSVLCTCKLKGDSWKE